MSAPRRQGWKVGAVTVGVAAAVALGWVFLHDDAGSARATSLASTPVPVQAPAAQPVATPMAPAAPSASTPIDVPPGVSADQWQQITAELSGRPDGPAELKRLHDYYTFADALQRFRALRTARPDDPALLPLARALDAGLSARVQRGEVSGPEGLLLKQAVLQVLETDDVQRAIQLRQWQQQALAVQQSQDAAQVADSAARDAAFKRQQATIVAAWQARPPDQRDPRLLQQQLDALRRASYPSTPGGR